MITREGTIDGAAGVSLHTTFWAPASEPRADVVLVHGYGEHSGRYHHVADRLTRAGLRVSAMDLRGHGRSAGVERGHVDSFELLVDDIARFVDTVRADLPLFVYGHSMGGLAAVRLAERDDSRLAGLILTGAALMTAESIPGALVKVANVLGRLAPGLPTIALDGNAVSRVEEVRADYDADPLNFRGKVSAGTAREINLAMGSAMAEAGRIHCPVLIMHGTDDTLSSPTGSVRLASAVGSEDRTIRLWPGCFHELHHEPEQDEVLGEIIEWIDVRLTTSSQ